MFLFKTKIEKRETNYNNILGFVYILEYSFILWLEYFEEDNPLPPLDSRTRMQKDKARKKDAYPRVFKFSLFPNMYHAISPIYASIPPES